MSHVHTDTWSRFVHLAEMIQAPAATALAVESANHIWYLARTITAEALAQVIRVPIPIEMSNAEQRGTYLRSIDLWYEISGAGAAITDISAAVYVETQSENGYTHSAELVDTTYDAAHDADAERITAASHKMTLSLDTPLWITPGLFYGLELTITTENVPGNPTILVYGARINGDYRL